MQLSAHRLEELLAQVRAVQAKVRPGTGVPASNPTDDAAHGALADRGEDRAFLKDMLAGLGRQELQELVALMWIGRGDYEASEWHLAVARVAEDVDRPLVDYLVASPLLAEQAADGYELVAAPERARARD